MAGLCFSDNITVNATTVHWAMSHYCFYTELYLTALQLTWLKKLHYTWLFNCHPTLSYNVLCYGVSSDLQFCNAPPIYWSSLHCIHSAMMYTCYLSDNERRAALHLLMLTASASAQSARLTSNWKQPTIILSSDAHRNTDDGDEDSHGMMGRVWWWR